MPVNGNQDAANFTDDNISGSTWVTGQPACTRYVHVMPPNTWSCRSGLQIAHNASSHHPGGVNVLFCDGSVKFIKSTHRRQHLVGHRHQGRRRGDFLRSVLSADGPTRLPLS